MRGASLILTVAVPFFVAFVSAVGLGQSVFRSPVLIPFESRVAAFAVDDLNLDGNPDIAVAVAGVGIANALQVFLHKGQNSGAGEIFEVPRAYAVGTGPVFVATGDLDGKDGLDLFVVNSGSSSASILLNDGFGRFLPTDDVPLGINPRVGQLADFNGDGNLDAVTSNLASFDVNVLLGVGDGRFQERQRLAVGDNPHFVVVEDFDGDGVLDLAVAHRDDRLRTGAVSCFKGNGDGSFDVPVLTDLRDAEVVPRIIAVGLFDGDDRRDMTVLTNERKLLFLKNGNDCVFDVSVVSEDAGTSPGIFRGFLLALDFEHDGQLDLLSPLERSGNHGLRVQIGDGRGSFEPRDFYLDGEISHVSIADFTGDGISDALVAWAESTGMAIVPGLAEGRLATRTVLPLEMNPRVLVEVSLPEKRRLLAAVSADSVALVELVGGTFRTLPPIELAGRAFQSAVAVDLDGRPGDELALADLASSEIVVVHFSDEGAFERAVVYPVDPLPSRLASGDFDGDGVGDLAVTHQASNNVTVLRRPGDDQEAENRVIAVDFNSTQTAVATGDVDGDGSLDIVAATRNGIRVAFGDGVGGFPRSLEVDDFANSHALVTAQLGGESVPDVVLTSRRRVVVLFDLGLGGALDKEVVEFDSEVSPLTVGDVDGDGLLDLLTADPTAVFLLRGLGGRGSSRSRFAVGLSPRSVIVGDFDGDGINDAGVAELSSKSISILHGTGLSAPEKLFRRGDSDFSGRVQLSDAVHVLEYLFRSGTEPVCLDASDSNDDGRVGIPDALYILNYLFRSGGTPPEPGPDRCGLDPTPDRTECDRGCRG